MIICRTCKKTKDETQFYTIGPCKSRPKRHNISKECKECTRLRTKNNSTPKNNNLAADCPVQIV